MSILTAKPMTAPQLWQEIEARRISITEALGCRLWVASIERVKKARRFGRDDMEVVSATASTPLRAVVALIEKLNAGGMGCPF
jgi:hypothetical protein